MFYLKFKYLVPILKLVRLSFPNQNHLLSSTIHIQTKLEKGFCLQFFFLQNLGYMAHIYFK